MRAVGQGVREPRIRDAPGAFRVLYVVKFVTAVDVLHCFRKSTRKTRTLDIDLARSRDLTLTEEIEE